MISQSVQSPIWQVSSGRIAQQNVSDYMLEHGLALIGPGDDGPWSPDRGPYEYDREVIQRFATEPSVGDALLLRTGRSTIKAIGLIASNYMYLEQCDDVAGFDLQHGRRVRWYELPVEHDFGFAISGGLSSKFSLVRNAKVQHYVARFLASPPTHWQNAPLPRLPNDEQPLTDVPPYVLPIVGLVSDLLPLYRDQAAFGPPPKENELTVHLVVPFLRALGWRQELIAAEWASSAQTRGDVVLFTDLPRGRDNLKFVVEVKGLNTGAEAGLEQAIQYAQTLDVDADIVVTDGVRYRMYAGRTEHKPVAYANLSRLKQSAFELLDRLRRA